MTSLPDPRPLEPALGELPAIELEGDRPPNGLTRGLVWSELEAVMRADARASGDDRFDRIDALSRTLPERTAGPREASPVPVERLREVASRPRRPASAPADEGQPRAA